MKLLFLTGALLLSTAVFAQQPVKLIESVLFQLNLRIEDCYERFITEKQMPDSPQESIVVIPKIVELEEDYFSLDTYIVIVNNVNGKIRNTYFESAATNGWQSDALQLERISIDTAPYLVKGKTRAFGIKVSFSASSRVSPYSTEKLSLFVTRGDKLDPVLKDFEVDRYNGDWDGDCAGEFVEREGILVISKNKTNDYLDILVKTKITTSNNTLKPNGDCAQESSVQKEEKILKFKNGKYQ